MRIAIDSGHGINTPGKRCLKSIDENETREWTLNNRVASYLSELLNGAGIDNRRVDDITGNIDVSLSKRVENAKSFNASYYISIHHNAGINGGSGGGVIVCHYDKPARRSDAEILYKNIIKDGGLIGNRSTPIQIRNDLYVLRATSMPALLVECGFMDSTTDTPIILQEEYSRKIARGILHFFFIDNIQNNICPNCGRPY